MEPTQSFRLSGTTDILVIPCDQDNGHNIIYWHDVLDAFPDAQYVKNGNVLIKKLRDTGTNRNKPQRIKHYPGVILDVVVSLPSANEPTASPTTRSKLSATCDRTNDISGTGAESSVDDNTIEGLEIIASNDDKQIARFEQGNSADSAFEQRLVSFLPPEIQTQVLGSSDVHGWMVQAIQNGQVDRLNEQLIACLQYLKDEMSKSNELACRNYGLVSDVKELALKNNELASDIKDLVHRNNDMASKSNELASKNNELASRNHGLVSDIKELALKNNDLASDIKDLAHRNNEVASKNNELVTDVRYLTLKNTELSTNIIKMQEAFDAKQEEVKQLQIQALSQLALLQNRVRALVTQTFELHEYPIPRLFIVLPQDTSSWDPIHLFSNKFRLYFLCECGEHTKSTNFKIPHHIHIAKHEGYEINRPNEFFEQYGHYVLTILRMLRFGISVAGVAIPAVSQLVRTDALDQATGILKALSGNIQKGMDQAIGCLEKIIADDTNNSNGSSEQMENNEALEGADLRKLETFLKNKDGNKVLGNLYRTITSHGHVKWICIDHYRENYHEKAVKVFRDTVESMGGSFDENIGRVTVHIRSKTQADQFYQALERSRSVFELDIALDWDTTQSDFKKLRDAVRTTSIGALRIDLKGQGGPTGDILNRGRRHDPIVDIMRRPSTHSIAIIGVSGKDFIERSSLQTRNDDFSNLRHRSIDTLKDIRVTDRDKLGGAQIKYLSTVVSWSELCSLVIDLRVEEGEERAQILEYIQWRHMRTLEIQVDKESTGVRAMKLVVEGRNKEQGQVELDYFHLYSYYFDTVSSECASLCKSFVALTSIKDLSLSVRMTPSDMESVLNSMDVTRLEVIRLKANAYSSKEVDRVLDCLTIAHNLKTVVLSWYTPTQQQIQRMHKRGVALPH
ncbi:hypothetical protein B0O80DRAFT_424019 [Mortierella sp. GBAus27b]|nr:hypothetical protein B0O80DRAFT_424019 [Mortierella sp. GBAus27b]